VASIINLNDATPAPPSGVTNVRWQGDASTPARNVSAYMPLLVGDDDPSSPLEAPASGAAPAPSSGDAAAGKFLKADGTWQVPTGTLTKVAAAFTNVTSFVFTHNLGTADITFAVWDSGGNWLLPQSVVVTSINVLTLTFGVAVTGRTVVIG
jgi:hypothetical protein